MPSGVQVLPLSSAERVFGELGQPIERVPVQVTVGLRRRGFRRPAFSRALIYGALLAGSVIMLFPFLWMLATSLKVDPEFFVTPPPPLPRPLAPSTYPPTPTP